ncbi:3-ketoacyl-ACP reductase [Propionivibrio sp.]|uniref:3-ketoacyl-ACP reductase n=1 Tax=Propionivibrio sp. TaxID=2212460 RepID=UPI0039E6F94A
MVTKSNRPVAIVTGAARGIGKGCAIALARSGFNLVLNDREGGAEVELLQELSAELDACGAETLIVPGDIAELARHQPLLDRTLDKWGRVDCLLNNAGVTVKVRGDLLEATPESFDRCIDVNTKAVFFLSQLVSKQMLAQGEIDGQHRSIINVTSCNATALAVSRAEYCISKAASAMTTKLFGLRLANEGIGVYEIRPGIIETEMTRPVKAKYDGFIAGGGVPNQRWGYPEDIASTVVCMAEGRLRFTVGQSIDIDGGLTIRHF